MADPSDVHVIASGLAASGASWYLVPLTGVSVTDHAQSATVGGSVLLVAVHTGECCDGESYFDGEQASGTTPGQEVSFPVITPTHNTDCYQCSPEYATPYQSTSQGTATPDLVQNGSNIYLQATGAAAAKVARTELCASTCSSDSASLDRACGSISNDFSLSGDVSGSSAHLYVSGSLTAALYGCNDSGSCDPAPDITCVDFVETSFQVTVTNVGTGHQAVIDSMITGVVTENTLIGGVFSLSENQSVVDPDGWFQSMLPSFVVDSQAVYWTLSGADFLLPPGHYTVTYSAVTVSRLKPSRDVTSTAYNQNCFATCGSPSDRPDGFVNFADYVRLQQAIGSSYTDPCYTPLADLDGDGYISADEVNSLLCSNMADFNGDGFVDIYDFDDYVDAFTLSATPVACADTNGDGFIDIFDYNQFVSLLSADLGECSDVMIDPAGC